MAHVGAAVGGAVAVAGIQAGKAVILNTELLGGDGQRVVDYLTGGKPRSVAFNHPAPHLPLESTRPCAA